MMNSGRFDGLHNREAFGADRRLARVGGRGKPAVNYQLRDWLLSRQRYWGCPIPVVHCETAGSCRCPTTSCRSSCRRRGLRAARAVAAGRGRGLGQHDCPKCGGPARRETDTMDTFVDSSWYFLRYCDAQNDSAPWDRDARRRVDAGRPVHRRRRARDPAPDVRALLREGARGHGPARLPGAVRRGSSPRG